MFPVIKSASALGLLGGLRWPRLGRVTAAALILYFLAAITSTARSRRAFRLRAGHGDACLVDRALRAFPRRADSIVDGQAITGGKVHLARERYRSTSDAPRAPTRCARSARSRAGSQTIRLRSVETTDVSRIDGPPGRARDCRVPAGRADATQMSLALPKILRTSGSKCESGSVGPSGSKAIWSHSSANCSASLNSSGVSVSRWFSRVRVATEVVVVVPALEVLVHEDHLVDLVAHVGLEDLGGDARMVRHGDRLADVVTQRGNDDFLVGSARSASVAVCRQCVS